MKCEWRNSLLGDFVQIKGGKRLPKGIGLQTIPNGHPYIRIRDMGKCKILNLNSDYEYVDDITQKSISRYIVNEGDIVISIVGTIGLVGIVGSSLNDANLTENCVRLINSGKLDRDYLYYYLISDVGQSEIRRGIVGAVQPKLPIKNIQEINIRFPVEVHLQTKIAKVLSALDDKIELNNQINKNLEEQAQSIFKRCFIDNEESLHWENATFSNLVVSTISGDWGKDSPSGNNKEEVYCIRGADIPEVQKGNIGKMPIRYILSKNLLSKQLSAGDIVVEISGGSPTQSTGRCASITQSLLNRYGGKMICTNFCRAIKVVPGYSSFVYYYLRYLYDKGTFFAYENGTTGIKNLDLTGFLETESIMIPPKAKIEEFDMLSQSVFSQIYANGKQNDGLSKLRDTLLPKLMSGEIDVDNVEI